MSLTAERSATQKPIRQQQKVWDGAPLVCREVLDEAPLVKTFRLVPEDGSRVRFQAGQNLTLEWSIDGEILTRTFTIASAPTTRAHVDLTIKAHPGGRVTNDLHKRLRPGMSLNAYGPGGRFCLAFRPSSHVLMLSAGSGITPMMSMLRWIRSRRYETNVALVHAARTPEEFLFVDELMAVTAARPNVSVTLVPTSVPKGRSFLGPRGRLTRKLLSAVVPDARRRQTFLCGPEGFMTDMRRALRAEGAPPDSILEERFRVLAHPLPPANTPVDGVALTLARAGRTVPAAPGRTIHAALREAGVVVPTGCRSGICGTCRVRRLAGETLMKHQGGVSPREEADGIILACCSIPLTDVSLDL